MTDSSFGATEPFPLLSAEACYAMQSGIVLYDKWKDLLCLFSSDRFQNLVNRLIDVSDLCFTGGFVKTHIMKLNYVCRSQFACTGILFQTFP